LASICSGQQVPLLRFPARVADHAGAAADDRNRRMPEPLQSCQPHQWQEMPDVQAGRGRIETGVRRHRAGGQQIRQALCGVVDKLAPRQFFEEIRHGVRIYYIN
jgi:hypothetical protein